MPLEIHYSISNSEFEHILIKIAHTLAWFLVFFCFELTMLDSSIWLQRLFCPRSTVFDWIAFSLQRPELDKPWLRWWNHKEYSRRRPGHHHLLWQVYTLCCRSHRLFSSESPICSKESILIGDLSSHCCAFYFQSWVSSSSVLNHLLLITHWSSSTPSQFSFLCQLSAWFGFWYSEFVFLPLHFSSSTCNVINWYFPQGRRLQDCQTYYCHGGSKADASCRRLPPLQIAAASIWCGSLGSTCRIASNWWSFYGQLRAWQELYRCGCRHLWLQSNKWWMNRLRSQLRSFICRDWCRSKVAGRCGLCPWRQETSWLLADWKILCSCRCMPQSRRVLSFRCFASSIWRTGVDVDLWNSRCLGMVLGLDHLVWHRLDVSPLAFHRRFDWLCCNSRQASIGLCVPGPNSGFHLSRVVSVLECHWSCGNRISKWALDLWFCHIYCSKPHCSCIICFSVHRFYSQKRPFRDILRFIEPRFCGLGYRFAPYSCHSYLPISCPCFCLCWRSHPLTSLHPGSHHCDTSAQSQNFQQAIASSWRHPPCWSCSCHLSAPLYLDLSSIESYSSYSPPLNCRVRPFHIGKCNHLRTQPQILIHWYAD